MVHFANVTTRIIIKVTKRLKISNAKNVSSWSSTFKISDDNRQLVLLLESTIHSSFPPYNNLLAFVVILDIIIIVVIVVVVVVTIPFPQLPNKIKNDNHTNKGEHYHLRGINIVKEAQFWLSLFFSSQLHMNNNFTSLPLRWHPFEILKIWGEKGSENAFSHLLNGTLNVSSTLT